MRKKIVTVCAALMIAASLAACGNENTTGATEGASAEATSEAEATTAAEASEDASEASEEETQAEASEASEEETQAEASEDASEAEDTTAAEDKLTYEGTYVETTAGRGSITIKKDDSSDLLLVTVDWANGANENISWTFSGQFNDNAELEYSNCLKTTTTYADENDTTGTTVENYNTGTGKLIFSDGTMKWQDDQDDAGKD